MTQKTKFILAGALAVLLIGSVCIGLALSEPKPMEELSLEEIAGMQGLLTQSNQQDGDVLGGANTTFRPSFYKVRLARSLSQGTDSTTIYVNSLNTADGHALATGDFGDFITLVINPNSSSGREIVSCTGTDTTAKTFTGCSRGYNFYNMSTGTARMVAHSPGETIIVSAEDIYQTTQYATLDTSQTFTGSKFFASSTAFKLGDGATTFNKKFTIYNGDTNEPYLAYDETANYFIVSNDGVNSVVIGGSSASSTAGKNLQKVSSVFSTVDTMYIPTLYTSSTAVSSTLQVAGSVTSTNLYPWGNNLYDLGAYDYAWNDIYASGTIYSTNFGNPLLPNADNTLSIGVYGTAFANVFASGTIYSGGSASGTSTVLMGTIEANTLSATSSIGNLQITNDLYVGTNKIIGSQQEFFFPFQNTNAPDYYNFKHTSSTAYPVVLWADGIRYASSSFSFRVPDSAGDVIGLDLIIDTPATSGNLAVAARIQASALGESPTTHTIVDLTNRGSALFWEIPIVGAANVWKKLDISNGTATTSILSAGDWIYGEIKAERDAGEDTVSEDIKVLGILLTIN